MDTIVERGIDLKDERPYKKAKLDEAKTVDKEDEMDSNSDIESQEEKDKGEGKENVESDSDDGYNTDDLFTHEYYTSEESKDEARRFYRTLHVEGPYAIDFCPREGYHPLVLIDPVIYPDLFEVVKVAAPFAIDQNNRNKGTELEFDSVIRASCCGAAGYVFFITLLAIDTQSGQKKTCRARVYEDISGELELIEFLDSLSMKARRIF